MGSWTIPGACLSRGITALAKAPDAGDDIEEGVVTGTSISGIKSVGQPVMEVSREEIEATGVSNLSLIARTPPIVLNGANIWDSTTASLNGRYFSVDLSKSW